MVWWFLAGAAVEVLNTLSRRWSVDHVFSVRAISSLTWLILAAGFLLRLGMTSALLALAFRKGIADGAAALVGYWLSRGAIAWWHHRLALRRAGG